jgi:hypothetical protein
MGKNEKGNKANPNHNSRYMLPDAYLHYILPRLRGDREVSSFGTDTATRITVMEFLQVTLTLTLPSLIHLILLLTLTLTLILLFLTISLPTLIVTLTLLQALLNGSKASQIAPYFTDLVSTLTDPYVIDPDSPRLITAAMKVIMVILNSMQGRGRPKL